MKFHKLSCHLLAHDSLSSGVQPGWAVCRVGLASQSLGPLAFRSLLTRALSFVSDSGTPLPPLAVNPLQTWEELRRMPGCKHRRDPLRRHFQRDSPGLVEPGGTPLAFPSLTLGSLSAHPSVCWGHWPQNQEVTALSQLAAF